MGKSTHGFGIEIPDASVLLTSDPQSGPGWDFQLSRWNFAPIIVSYPLQPDGELICFAPPGASLYGETEPELSGWRKGVWVDESTFAAGRGPELVEPLAIAEVDAQLPEDFCAWGRRETAAHIERLRAFTQRRPQRADLSSAAERLREELEALEPGALERHHLEAGLEVARTDVLERRRRTPSDVLSLRSLARTGRFGLVKQILLLFALYGAYRWVRPATQVHGSEISLAKLPFQSIPELLAWGYGNGHVLVTFGFLGWLFFRRHSAFPFVRNAVLVAAGLTVLPYLLFPSSAAHGAAATVPPSALTAMPAMHLSVALVIGCSAAVLVRSWTLRAIWIAYPCLALGIVVASQPSDLAAYVAGGFAAFVTSFVLADRVGQWSFRHRRLPATSLAATVHPRLGHDAAIGG